jgi:hypothetical protein
MEHGEKADLRTKVLGVSGDGKQGLHRGPEQDAIELSLILIGNCSLPNFPRDDRLEPRAIDNNKSPLPQRIILPGVNSTDSLLLMFRLRRK